MWHWLSFNPRTRVGCDVTTDTSIAKVMVSIHAPVWGATQPYNFKKGIAWFQSTHPCGVRLITRPKCRAQCGFNPRTRVGCDTKQPAQCNPLKFQSTHPCGVRRFWLASPIAELCFNPRTRVGCDQWRAKARLLPVFQSTHPCGVRPS